MATPRSPGLKVKLLVGPTYKIPLHKLKGAKGIHPEKLTCPLKRGYFSREYIFQPLIFRGHVSFPGCKANLRCAPTKTVSKTVRFSPNHQGSVAISH